jgi:transmembrane sensor
MHKVHDKIFEDYLRDAKRKKSERAFLDLFCGKMSEHALKQKVKKDWDAIIPEEYSGKDLSPILYKIHFLINSERSAVFQRYKVRNMLNWYHRFAAIILLPLLAVGIFYLISGKVRNGKPSVVEVIAPMGARIHTQLPDGSQGWLNSGSVLTYSIPFEKRDVRVEGEAFFDVQTDSLHPFIVKGKHGSVRVLGTRFNVRMWSDEELIEVVLERGKVELKPDGSEKVFEMSPGEMLVYNSGKGTLSRKKVDAKLYSAWIEGKLMLRGKTMQELAREISRWFSVDVEVEDKSLKEYTFRATFENEKLEEVLRLLKMTSPIEYEIIDNHQNSDGDFSRKKVIIRHE